MLVASACAPGEPSPSAMLPSPSGAAPESATAGAPDPASIGRAFVDAGLLSDLAAWVQAAG
jgi:hypothetical protein